MLRQRLGCDARKRLRGLADKNGERNLRNRNENFVSCVLLSRAVRDVASVARSTKHTSGNAGEHQSVSSIKSHLHKYNELRVSVGGREALGGGVGVRSAVGTKSVSATVPDWTLDAADGARRTRNVHATAPRTR